MMARIRKSVEEKGQGGFTLIELLVVMIIIGILAAVAIPVFLSQREKAADTAAKSDVSILGKEIATWYVDNTGAPPAVAIDGAAPNQTWTVDGESVGNVSKDLTLLNGGATGTGSGDWCIAVEHPGGDKQQWQYSAAGGLAEGDCVP